MTSTNIWEMKKNPLGVSGVLQFDTNARRKDGVKWTSKTNTRIVLKDFFPLTKSCCFVQQQQQKRE